MNEPRINVFKRPMTRSIGLWREMDYDASLKLDGLRWLRAEGGFGDSGQREDWVCDLPAVGVNVSLSLGEYSKGWSAGFDHFESRTEAMRRELTYHAQFVVDEIAEAEENLAKLREAKLRMDLALGVAVPPTNEEE